MPLNQRAKKIWKSFNAPVSYQINEAKDKLRDAQNVFSNQGRLETRFGYSRFLNTSLGESIQSISYFQNGDGKKYIIAKAGTTLYSIDDTKVGTAIKTGLTATTKHRGITMYGRHIIGIESDGLFSYDGTTFAALSQDPDSGSMFIEYGSESTLVQPTISTGTYEVFISFYSSTLGIETNISSAILKGSGGTTVDVAVGAPIIVYDPPTSVDNSFFDRIRIYLKETSGDVYTRSRDIALNELPSLLRVSSSYPNSLHIPLTEEGSAETPETTNDVPFTGGGKYLTTFRNRLVYCGSEEYPHDVFFSQEDQPDFFDLGTNAKTLFIEGDGPITGIAVGLFDDNILDPYLLVFKKRSVHFYSERDELPTLIKLSGTIGCIGHDTIVSRNGDIFFMSMTGWNAIMNGRLVKDKKKKVVGLGQDDIADIFTKNGYEYQLNLFNSNNFFSAYYSAFDQIINFISEGASNEIDKSYVYQFNSEGFFPWKWALPIKAACTGEDDNGREVLFLADGNGWIYTHSSQEKRSDVDATNTETAITAFAKMQWLDGSDFDATYSFRELLLRCVNSEGDVTVRAYLDFDERDYDSHTYEFTGDGFQLDVDYLDIDYLSDDRKIVTARADINRTAENILIEIRQSVVNTNIGLISMQIDFNKNGNRNL